MRRELTCILCPQGCTLEVEYREEKIVDIEGNRCKRGIEYAKEEILNPTRIVTSTVRVKGGIHPVIPVKTKKAIPKYLIFSAMEEINQVVIEAPIECGQILVGNLAGSGVSLVASRSMKKSSTL